MLAGLSIALVTSATLLLSGCSSSSPHDININTDVGVGFEPADGATSTTIDDTAADDGSTVDTAIAGDVLVDAAIDGAG